MRLNVSVVSHVLKKVSSSIGLWDPAFAQDKKLCAISLSGVSMLLINLSMSTLPINLKNVSMIRRERFCAVIGRQSSRNRSFHRSSYVLFIGFVENCLMMEPEWFLWIVK